MEKSWMEKSWQRSREQKQNNRGSSLVLVVSVMAIVGIFAVIMLSLSLMNYRMKYVNLHAQDNFYDAEKVLDEIRTGLAVDVASAADYAYQNTMEQYSTLTPDERTENYKVEFYDQMKTSAVVNLSAASQWDPAYLESLVSAEAKAGTKDGTGLEINSADGLFHLNQVDQQFVIKKLKITYVDQNDYMTEIQTDINITCPELDFTQQTKVPELTNYCIVAQNQTKADGLKIDGASIKGNAYLGDQGAEFKNSDITFIPNGASGYISTAGTFDIYNVSSVKVNSGLEVWGRDLYLDSSSWESEGAGCKLYLNDDITLENHTGGSTVTLRGEVFAYGNPDNVRGSGVYVDNNYILDVTSGSAVRFRDDVNNNPENYSSAFLINGKNATLDLRGVTKMQIAGNAYVATKKETKSWDGKAHENASGSTVVTRNAIDAMMGESIAMKSDQRAYLVPTEYMAPDCSSGGMNPMNSKDYLGTDDSDGLVKQVAEKFHKEVDDILKDPTWLIRDENGNIYSFLANAGVVGVRQAYFPTNIAGSDGKNITMVYFFLVFKNDAAAKNYADNYFAERADELNVRIDSKHYDTTVLHPTENITQNALRFYFNGSILQTVQIDENNKTGGFVSGLCDSVTPENRAELAKLQNSYQETFAALCHTLKTDYTELTSKEKEQTVFQNLVKKDDLPGEVLELTNATSGETAIVTKDNYTIDNNSKPNVHVVIAGGNVSVARNFTGLILAGGDIILEKNDLNIQSDSGLVRKALAGTDGTIRAADFLYNGDQYLFPEDRNVSSADVGSSFVNFLDSVTYSNWKKQ